MTPRSPATGSRRRRPAIILMVVVAVLGAAAVGIASPWFGHLGLPWPGPRREHAVASAGPHALTSGSPSPAAPAQVVARPRVRALTVRPRHIYGPATLRLAFDAPAGSGVTVSWAIVDTLGRVVGARGPVRLAAGRESVSWRARTAAGGPLFPGTYRLRVKASDAAGDRTVAFAPFTCSPVVRARAYTRLARAGRRVALTFDGGSGYAWRHIMMALAGVHAHGSFFCTGVSVVRYPAVAKEAVALGMTIGNHSYDHPDFRHIGHGAQLRQLRANERAWWRACRATPAPFFRPPYGSFDKATLRVAGAAGYPFVVLWDVDTGDWTGVSAATIARRAVKRAHPGSIILMHTLWSTQKAVRAIVRELRAKGLEPVGLDELFHAAGRL